ncbi:hypothetical protein OTK49_03210 [Vibrio coralliirubri]|uniref:hypothetical protein n=1 Tax=Vibrio coralliirubri TaxID=1516159 RepID=UPI002284EC38|nr:hypothetical protein [Vibrio coralliirubri]MCY9861525.1 hypothetical protein [Vibrio coralliirubri]
MNAPALKPINGYTVNTVDGVKMLVGKVPMMEAIAIVQKDTETLNVLECVMDTEIAKAYSAAIAWGYQKDTDALRVKLGIPTGNEVTNA